MKMPKLTDEEIWGGYERPDEAKRLWNDHRLPDWAFEELGRQVVAAAFKKATAEHEKAGHDLKNHLYENESEKEGLEQKYTSYYVVDEVAQAVNRHLSMYDDRPPLLEPTNYAHPEYIEMRHRLFLRFPGVADVWYGRKSLEKATDDERDAMESFDDWWDQRHAEIFD